MANLKIKNGKIITGTEGIALSDSANIATGDNAVAEGGGTTASGSESHAEGLATVANAQSAHAEGGSTTASNTDAHAEGGSTTASGAYAHSQNHFTVASGQASHAGGEGTSSASPVSATANSSFNHSKGTSSVQSISSAILGGTGNDIWNASTFVSNYSAILGGQDNIVYAQTADAFQGIIIGGTTNAINSSSTNIIIGGSNNTINGGAIRSTIIGGQSITLAESDTVYLGGIKRGGYVLANTLTAANTNSSSTAYNTVWSFNAVAGAIYKMEMIGNYQTAALTTGIKIKLGGTATCDVVGKLYGAVSNAAVATELAIPATSMTSELITTGVAVINAPHFVGADVVFRCTVAGTVLVTMASEVNTSAAQLNIGSTCVVERIN